MTDLVTCKFDEDLIKMKRYWVLIFNALKGK